jgi:hypothetical protein
LLGTYASRRALVISLCRFKIIFGETKFQIRPTVIKDAGNNEHPDIAAL